MMNSTFKNENTHSLNQLVLQVTNNLPNVKALQGKSPQEQAQYKLKPMDQNIENHGQ